MASMRAEHFLLQQQQNLGRRFGTSKMHLSPPVAYAAVRSKAVVLLSSWCLVMVERLFLAVPRCCLQFVIVVFPDHTHLLFLLYLNLEGLYGFTNNSNYIMNE